MLFIIFDLLSMRGKREIRKSRVRPNLPSALVRFITEKMQNLIIIVQTDKRKSVQKVVVSLLF